MAEEYSIIVNKQRACSAKLKLMEVFHNLIAVYSASTRLTLENLLTAVKEEINYILKVNPFMAFDYLDQNMNIVNALINFINNEEKLILTDKPVAHFRLCTTIASINDMWLLEKLIKLLTYDLTNEDQSK